MRHVIVNAFVYVLAALLLVGSIAFAAIRDAQLVISDEATVAARHEETPARPFAWRELGARAYAANCRRCHGAAGRGWDQYPGLAGMDAFAAAPGGRDYLIAVHLWGVASPRWRAPMPPMGHLPDAELAAVIDHVLTSFGNELPPGVPLITPAEVAAHRARRLRAWQVDRLRPALAAPREARAPWPTLEAW